MPESSEHHNRIWPIRYSRYAGAFAVGVVQLGYKAGVDFLHVADEEEPITTEQFALLEADLSAAYEAVQDARNPVSRFASQVRLARLQGRIALHFEESETQDYLLTHKRG